MAERVLHAVAAVVPRRLGALFIPMSIVLAASGSSSSTPALLARTINSPFAEDAAMSKAGGDDVSIIVSLRETVGARREGGGVDRARLTADIAARRSRVLAAVPPSEFHVRHAFEAVPAITGTATRAGIDLLGRQADVAAISINRRVHADLAQAALLINVGAVHTELGVTGSGVTVALFDSGVVSDHPMLSNDLVYQECFLSSGNCPDGGTTGTSAEDGFGHGTHVAGIVTSSGPPSGIAPDVKIEAFKVLDDTGSGTFEDILAAYDSVIASHPEVRIINMSLGDEGAYAAGTCEGFIPALTAAVTVTRAMGITTFASAGNTGSKTGIAYPACVDQVVSVGAVFDADYGSTPWGVTCTDTNPIIDNVPCFSQSGSALDLLAPGAKITSTYLGAGLAQLSGTSMASPVAAAVAALILQQDPSVSPAALELRLKQTGVARTDSRNGVTTCRVDAYRAVTNDPTNPCGPQPSDGDTDGVPDGLDNCPDIANSDQANFDTFGQDNGPGIAGDDWSVPDGDSLGDACDTDDDNDQLVDGDESAAGGCGPFDLSLNPRPDAQRGDSTNDDNGNGDPALPMGTDAADNGPSWDTDNDGVLDGVECALGHNPRDRTDKPNASECGGSVDADHDGLTAAAERCKWGTSDAAVSGVDSDGDGLKDCVEANDLNGDGVQNFPGDTLNSAKASAGIIGRTMDFDLNGDGAANFPGDTILSAKAANHIGGICT